LPGPRIHMVSLREEGGLERLRSILASRSGASLLDYVEKVLPIVRDVARRGYEAVREYTLRFDGVDVEDPVVPREAMRSAYESLDERLRWALGVAARRLSLHHGSTRPPETWVPGARLHVDPVERVGAYAPGGLHPYPSTVLHTVIPARAAGAGFVAVATPPCRGGCGGWLVNPATLGAAYVAGADVVYAVGGAQAVAALAFGAEPVARVDKVVGPGNPYVQAAKLLVSSVVGVDMTAGPTELMVVADGSADPMQVALDMAAEAEHGPLSVSILATPERRLLEDVASMLERLLGEEHGSAVLVETRSMVEAYRVADMVAAEHLVIYAEEPPERPPRAGIVSRGVPPALLDYAYGPSHVLPTGGAARWRGGGTSPGSTSRRPATL